MPVKLKPRLAGIASLVPSGTVVADIGTDHAYLPVYLVQEKACPRVIAVEKSELNSRMAQETVNLFNLNHKVEVRVGNGLLALEEKDDVEIVVIAGLGGKSICRMLIAAADRLGSYKSLVLQPMGDVALVRRWLVAHGFCFAREKLVQEKEHFYEVIAVEKGRQTVKEPILLEIGPTLLKDRDPLLIPWLEYKLKRYEKVMQELLRSRNGKNNPRWRYFNFQYDRLKGVLEDVCRGE
jgi:tRNA (adenine22-N1)-methyltransferase